jgi:hypothetical protein
VRALEPGIRVMRMVLDLTHLIGRHTLDLKIKSRNRTIFDSRQNQTSITIEEGKEYEIKFAIKGRERRKNDIVASGVMRLMDDGKIIISLLSTDKRNNIEDVKAILGAELGSSIQIEIIK